MPSNTVNFNLPYPNGTDEPCDFAEQWCDFTDALDGVFDTFQGVIDRTIPVVPLAILQQTVARNIPNLGIVQFDTVLADTAGMTDIDVDPFHITVRRPGRYTVGAMLQKQTVGVPFIVAYTSVFVNPHVNAVADLLDRGVGVTYYFNPYYTVDTYAAGDKISLSFAVSANPTVAIEASWLAVVWHSDTEVP